MILHFTSQVCSTYVAGPKLVNRGYAIFQAGNELSFEKSLLHALVKTLIKFKANKLIRLLCELSSSLPI